MNRLLFFQLKHGLDIHRLLHTWRRVLLLHLLPPLFVLELNEHLLLPAFVIDFPSGRCFPVSKKIIIRKKLSYATDLGADFHRSGVHILD
jgi:GT2 family glycosyltransferase